MKNQPTVSIIIPVYKVACVLEGVLTSIYNQTYPIAEIILIDNHSPDDSVSVARRFASNHKKISIRIIVRKKTYGISESYNLGAKLAKSEYIVTLHSDSLLPTPDELSRLMKPFAKESCIAAMPIVVHRKKEWDEYNFWQKCLFAHVVGKQGHALNGKFDAYKRETFLSLGGYDTDRFNHFIGSEDADMGFRLKKAGRIAKTNAYAVHVHGKDPSYRLGDWIARRKFLAVSYGRQIQLHAHEMGLFGLTQFFVKPAIALITVFAVVHPVFFVPILVFPFWYMRSMFLDSESRKNPDIFLLPLVVMYLVFAETVWMLHALFRRTL